MKKIAFILLLLFAAVQLIPAINSFSGQKESCAFFADDKKSSEKGKEENKKEVEKYLASFTVVKSNQSPLINIDGEAHNALQHPYLEYLTPPPDLC